jgi:pyruvate formate lyase activating enzyme
MKSFAEVAYKSEKCIGTDVCDLCKRACAVGAISNADAGKISINRELCNNCLACSGACPAEALHTFGNQMSVQEVIKAVEADSAFYTRSGGGLTVSGGEPLMQSEFTVALLKEAKKHRINVTIETSGYAEWSKLEEVAQLLKLIIFDIKHIDEEKHREFTGVSNALILNNFKMLRETFPELEILVRTPVIPGFNDSEEELSKIIGFIKDLPNVKYEILPYHPLGQSKYGFLGRDFPMGDVKLSDEKFKSLKVYVQQAMAGSR